MKILKQSLTLFLLFQSFLSNAQNYPGFSESLVNKLNTASKETYLAADEKEVVLMLNLVRYNGQIFWDSIAVPYIKTYNIAPSSYLASLKQDLKHVKNLEPLKADKKLYEAAKKHAVASGKSGSVGHESSAGSLKQRVHPYKGTFAYISENCDYGSANAIDILMNLLIDEGIPDVGHRVNILEPRINVVGVSIAPHKTYHHTCVQVFGEVLQK